MAVNHISSIGVNLNDAGVESFASSSVDIAPEQFSRSEELSATCADNELSEPLGSNLGFESYSFYKPNVGASDAAGLEKCEGQLAVGQMGAVDFVTEPAIPLISVYIAGFNLDANCLTVFIKSDTGDSAYIVGEGIAPSPASGKVFSDSSGNLLASP